MRGFIPKCSNKLDEGGSPGLFEGNEMLIIHHSIRVSVGIMEGGNIKIPKPIPFKSKDKPINKYKVYYNSGFFGYIFATIVVMAIEMINMIVFILFELGDIPERNRLIIPQILLLIVLISFGIVFIYFIKLIEKKGKHQFDYKTILISFVICFIMYEIAFWVLWP